MTAVFMAALLAVCVYVLRHFAAGCRGGVLDVLGVGDPPLKHPYDDLTEDIRAVLAEAERILKETK
jgi:hypothetical protein